MAGTHVAGALEIQMMMGIARLQADVTQAKNVVGRGMQSIERSVSLAKSALGALGIGLGVAYFGRLITGALQAQDELAKLSQKLNISVEQLAGLRHAADLAGVSGEALTKGFKTLSSQMFDASMGLLESKRNFGLLGIEVKKSDGTLRDTQAVMLQVADKFAAMQDGAAKSALAVKLFGKSGLDMIPMLNEGSGAIARMIEEGQRLNPVTAESAKQAEVFNDNMTRVGGTLKGVFIQAMNAVLPGISDISKAMAEAAKESGFWAAALVGLGGVISKIFQLPELQKANKEFIDLTNTLLKLQNIRDQVAAGERGDTRSWFLSLGAGSVEDVDKKIANVTKRLVELQKVRDDFAKPPPGAPKPLATLNIPDEETLKKAKADLEKYLKEMKALAIKSTEARLLAEEQMREDEGTRIREDYLANKKIQDDARKESAAGDIAAFAAKWDAAQELGIQLGQLDLKRIKDREKLEIDAAKKALDFRMDQERKAADELSRLIGDGLMRGFEKGEGFAKTFRDTLVNMFKTLVLRPIINFVVNPISGAINSVLGSLGGSAVSSVLGSGGSLLRSLFGSGSATAAAGFSSAGTVGTSAALAWGGLDSAAISAAGTSLGVSAGAGLMSTIGAALPWVGGALLIGSALGLFGKKKKEDPKYAFLQATTSGAGGPAGELAVTQYGTGGLSNVSVPAYEAFNTWLGQLPEKVTKAVDGMTLQMANATDQAAALGVLNRQIIETARTLNLTEAEWRKVIPTIYAVGDALVASMGGPAEQLEFQVSQLNAAFAAAGVTAIPQTREEFAQLVSGIDVTTDAGVKFLAALQEIAPAFLEVERAQDELVSQAKNLTIQYYEATGQTEKAKDMTRRLVLEGLDPMLHGLQKNVWAAQDAARIASTNLQWSDRLALATGTMTARDIELREITEQLGITTDATTIELMEQTWAAEDLADATRAASEAMDTALGNQASLWNQLATPAQRLALDTQNLNAGFAALGLTVPNSAEDFAELVRSIDITTPAGQALIAALTPLAPIFIRVSDAVQEMAENLITSSASIGGVGVPEIADAAAATFSALMGQAAGSIRGLSGGDFGKELSDTIAYIQAKVPMLQGAIATAYTQSGGYRNANVVASESVLALAQEQIRKLVGDLADYTILEAQYEGRGQRLLELQKWYEQERDALAGNLEARAIMESEFERRRLEIINDTNDAVLDDYAKARDQLTSWLGSMALNQQLSPLTARQQLDEAQAQYVENLMKAQGNDLTAIDDFSQYAEAYLEAQKAVTGFGGDYSAIWQAIMAQGRDLATGDNGAPTRANFAELRQSQDDTKVVLARLLERLNELTAAQTEQLITAISSGAARQASATEKSAAITVKA